MDTLAELDRAPGREKRDARQSRRARPTGHQANDGPISTKLAARKCHWSPLLTTAQHAHAKALAATGTPVREIAEILGASILGEPS
jgi:hypothetical protein